MRMVHFVSEGGTLLGVALACVGLSAGCDSGRSATIRHVVETPEQREERDKVMREAMQRGAYGKIKPPGVPGKTTPWARKR